jgi:ribosomal protein S10
MKCHLILESFSSKNIVQSTEELKKFLKKKIILKVNNSKFEDPLIFKSIYLPKKITKHTLLKSPHIDKKSREQFERIIYRKLIIILPKLKLTKQNFLILIFRLKKILKNLSCMGILQPTKIIIEF